jgi:hypothetical protein
LPNYALFLGTLDSVFSLDLLNFGKMFLYFIFVILCWECIVTFTKSLAIYHGWTHPFQHSPLSSFHSWNSFNWSHFSIYIHVYRIFPPYSSSKPLSLYIFLSHWYPVLRQDLFCHKTFVSYPTVSGLTYIDCCLLIYSVSFLLSAEKVLLFQVI